MVVKICGKAAIKPFQLILNMRKVHVAFFQNILKNDFLWKQIQQIFRSHSFSNHLIFSEYFQCQANVVLGHYNQLYFVKYKVGQMNFGKYRNTEGDKCILKVANTEQGKYIL